jgi:Ran GTPase-activating protein (RanGAP) involved in mRNA processing and transport
LDEVGKVFTRNKFRPQTNMRKKIKLNLKEGLLIQMKEFLQQHEQSTFINFEDFPYNCNDLCSLINSNKSAHNYIRDWFENNIQIKSVNTGELHTINFLSLETNKNIVKLQTGSYSTEVRDYLIKSIPKNNTIESLKFRTLNYEVSQIFKSLIDGSIKEFGCENSRMTYENMKELCSSLRDNKNILKLDLSKHPFMNPGLKSISWKNRGSKFLREILIGNKTIQELYLNNCGMNSDDLKNLVDGLAENSTVKILHLQFNSIKAGKYISYMENLLGNQNLTELNLHDCKLQMSMNYVCEGLKKNQSLTSLNLSKNNLKISAITLLVEGLKGNQTLQFLDLSSNSFKDPSMIELCKFLNENYSLKNLDISNNGLSNSSMDIVEYLSNNNSLEIISLSGNDLEMKHFSNLKENISLKEFNFENKIDDEQSIHFVDALKNLKSLEMLNIPYVYSNFLSNTGNGLNSICSFMEKNKSIKTLKIGSHSFDNSSAIGKLFNSNLENLDLYPLNGSIGFNALTQIEKEIQNSNVKHLHITFLHEETVPIICSILENKSCLKKFEIGFQIELQKPEFLAIMDSLEMNKTIETFRYFGTPVEFDSTIMENRLRYNHTLKEFLVNFSRPEMISSSKIVNNSQRKKFNFFRRFETHFCQKISNIKMTDIQFHWN